MAARTATYADELAALVEAAFRVVADRGTLDPPVRAIIAEAGLSTQALYRHVESKDELLLIMLDEGRRALVAYLDQQIARCADATERRDAWVRGVLAQAVDPVAARRTRPFMAHVDRLAERFPDEQRRSEELLVEQVAGAAGIDRVTAVAVYDVAFGALGRHLRRQAAPEAHEIDAVVNCVSRLCGRGGDR